MTVDLSEPGDSFALHLEGTFLRGTASGTLRYTVVTLTEEETARLCTTGDLTWTAERYA